MKTSISLMGILVVIAGLLAACRPTIVDWGPALGAVTAARAAAVQETGASAREVVVRKATAMDWSNTSLGCPEPGLQYADVITPGWVILVDMGGKTLTYHTDEHGDQVVRCDGQ